MSKAVDPSEYAISLGILGWLRVLSKSIGIGLGLLLKAALALFSGQNNRLSFCEYITYEGIRDYQCGLSAVEIQNLVPSTSKTCIKLAKRYSLPLLKIHLADGTMAFWLGPRKANKLIVLFHGGGYMAPALDEHISFSFGFAEPPQKGVTVVVLQYDLASESANHYPRQLQQAVSLIEYLVHYEEIPPSSITLIGDSAGANLLLGLILHLNHPNPSVSPLRVADRLSGAILVSPWVSMDLSSDSMMTNSWKDTLSPSALAYWRQNFLGGSGLDPWNSPLMAPSEWWNNAPVEDIFILYGDDEILRDDISKLCRIIEANHLQTTSFSFPGEIHDHMIVNRFLGAKKDLDELPSFCWIGSALTDRQYAKKARCQPDQALATADLLVAKL